MSMRLLFLLISYFPLSELVIQNIQTCVPARILEESISNSQFRAYGGSLPVDHPPLESATALGCAPACAMWTNLYRNWSLCQRRLRVLSLTPVQLLFLRYSLGSRAELRVLMLECSAVALRLASLAHLRFPNHFTSFRRPSSFHRNNFHHHNGQSQLAHYTYCVHRSRSKVCSATQ